jgi:hypothetical protein
MLPVELLQSLSRSVPCREHQLWQLATLYNVSFPSCAETLSFSLTDAAAEPIPCPTSPRRLRPRCNWQECRCRGCARCKADPLRDGQMCRLSLSATLVV